MSDILIADRKIVSCVCNFPLTISVLPSPFTDSGLLSVVVLSIATANYKNYLGEVSQTPLDFTVIHTPATTYIFSKQTTAFLSFKLLVLSDNCISFIHQSMNVHSFTFIYMHTHTEKANGYKSKKVPPLRSMQHVTLYAYT